MENKALAEKISTNKAFFKSFLILSNINCIQGPVANVLFVGIRGHNCKQKGMLKQENQNWKGSKNVQTAVQEITKKK